MMGFENEMGLKAHLFEPTQSTISNFRRVEVGVSTPESSDKMNGRRGESGEEEKGLLWRLPVLKSKHLGKVGPAFGLGVGCGFGFGVGLIGGVGLGPGIHGLQFGFGFGAGCGIGLGFGYGVGRGIAQDQSRRYSNVGNLSHQNIPSQDDIVAIVDELVLNSKKLIRATSKEIDKWRR